MNNSVSTNKQYYEYKMGSSVNGLTLTLLGAGTKKEKCFKDILSDIEPSVIESLFNRTLERSQANQKKIIGDMSALFTNFCEENDTTLYDGFDEILNAWKEYYTEKMPNAIEQASNKFFFELKRVVNCNMFVPLGMPWTKKAEDYYKEASKAYISRIVFVQTAYGLYLEREILSNLAEYVNEEYRKDYTEESLGIDGWVGETAFTVKPKSYIGGSVTSGIMIKYCKEKENMKINFLGNLPDGWIERLQKSKYNKTITGIYKQAEEQ